MVLYFAGIFASKRRSLELSHSGKLPSHQASIISYFEDFGNSLVIVAQKSGSEPLVFNFPIASSSAACPSQGIHQNGCACLLTYLDLLSSCYLPCMVSGGPRIGTPECLINIVHVRHTYSYYKLQIATELQSLIQTFEYNDAVYKYKFS
jgi:hypothetical protein